MVQLIPMALDKVHHDMVVNNVLSETRIRWHASGVRGCCGDEVFLLFFEESSKVVVLRLNWLVQSPCLV